MILEIVVLQIQIVLLLYIYATRKVYWLNVCIVETCYFDKNYFTIHKTRPEQKQIIRYRDKRQKHTIIYFQHLKENIRTNINTKRQYTEMKIWNYIMCFISGSVVKISNLYNKYIEWWREGKWILLVIIRRLVYHIYDKPSSEPVKSNNNIIQADYLSLRRRKCFFFLFVHSKKFPLQLGLECVAYGKLKDFA